MTVGKHFIGLLVLLALGGAVIPALPGCVVGVSEQELASRTRSSQPAWQNYEEDIKAQIGATPVAQWQGAPIEVRRDGDRLYVTFRLSGPWAQRDIAIPVLLRDPLGRTYQNVRAQRDGHVVTYVFPLFGEDPAVPLAWVKLRFPGTERRIALSGGGAWQETP